MMNIIDKVKKATEAKAMDLFKENVKKMSPDQILDLLIKTANDTAKNVIADIEKGGMSIAELKEKWLQ